MQGGLFVCSLICLVNDFDFVLFCFCLCSFHAWKKRNSGAWFLENCDIWRECLPQKLRNICKEMQGNLAILEGNFDWVPRENHIFNSRDNFFSKEILRNWLLLICPRANIFLTGWCEARFHYLIPPHKFAMYVHVQPQELQLRFKKNLFSNQGLLFTQTFTFPLKFNSAWDYFQTKFGHKIMLNPSVVVVFTQKWWMLTDRVYFESLWSCMCHTHRYRGEISDSLYRPM